MVPCARRLVPGNDHDTFLRECSRARPLQELFNAFACGGRVVLAAPGMEKDTQALARLISSQGITNCSCVPSQLEVLLMVCFLGHSDSQELTSKCNCISVCRGHGEIWKTWSCMP